MRSHVKTLKSEEGRERRGKARIDSAGGGRCQRGATGIDVPRSPGFLAWSLFLLNLFSLHSTSTRFFIFNASAMPPEGLTPLARR
jgi:hypothetical protein